MKLGHYYSHIALLIFIHSYTNQEIGQANVPWNKIKKHPAKNDGAIIILFFSLSLFDDGTRSLQGLS